MKPIQSKEEFDELACEHGFKTRRELLAACKKVEGIKKSTLEKIRSQNYRNFGRVTLRALAELLSLVGKEITPSELDIKLGWIEPVTGENTLRAGQDTGRDTVAEKLATLSESLRAKLSAIHYEDRNLKRLTVGHKGANSSEDDEVITVAQLSRKKCALVIGEAGLGKSTLLDDIARYSALNNRIPVYVDLSIRIVEELEHFESHVWACAQSYRGVDNVAFSPLDSKSTDVVFLFDHLDLSPRPSANEIPEVVRLVNSFLNKQGRLKERAQFIVCCRTNFDSYYRKLHPSFDCFELLNLNSEDNIPRLLEAHGVPSLLSDSLRERELLDFAKNPLRLVLLAEIYKANTEDGKEIRILKESDIYDQHVDLHIEREIRERELKAPKRLVKRLLARLAFESFTSAIPGAQEFRRGWAVDFLQEILPKAVGTSQINGSLVIEGLISGGLITLSSDGRRFEFYHPLLRDFFCALHLARNNSQANALEILLAKAGDPEKRLGPEWEKVFLLYAGLVKDVTPLVAALADKEEVQDDIFRTNLLLAGKCLASSTLSHDNPTYTQVMDEVWEMFLQAEDPNFLGEAPEVLGSYTSPSFIDDLFTKLRSRDKGTQCRSLIVLSLLATRSGTVTQQLLSLLDVSHRRIRSIRTELVEILADLHCNDAVQPLVKLLGDSSGDLKGTVARSLARLGTRNAIEALVGLLRQNLEDDSWRFVEFALVHSKSEIAVELLGELLLDEDVPWEARLRAMTPLALIGSKKAIEVISWGLETELKGLIIAVLALTRSNRVVELLKRLLEDEDVRTQTIWTLAWIGTPEALEPLISLLNDKTHDLALCETIVRRLRYCEAVRNTTFDLSGALEALLQLLNNPDVEFKADVITILRAPEACGLLVNLLETSDPEIQRAAVRALGRNGCEEAVNNLVKLFSHRIWDAEEPWPLGRVILHSIESIGTPEVVSVLQGIASDGSVEEVYRMDALESLDKIDSGGGHLQDQDVEPDFLEARIKGRPSLALELSDPGFASSILISELVRICEEKDEYAYGEHCVEVAKVLLQIGAGEGIDKLVCLLGNENTPDTLRSGVARAMKEVQPFRAIEALSCLIGVKSLRPEILGLLHNISVETGIRITEDLIQTSPVGE